jgi:hypothetical protein
MTGIIIELFLKNKIRKEKIILKKIIFSHKINLKLTSITIKTCNQQPQLSTNGSDITISFLNIIHAAKTIKQNYLKVLKILLDRSKVI